MSGSLTGAVGKWTSIAGDDKRVMVATYDQVFGDLVAVDATDQTKLDYKTVDGVPDETPTYDPSTWRGGISDPGPNVGAWTSIVLANHTARIAYQDRDATALKYAYETSTGGDWKSYVIDAGHGEAVGAFSKMIMDSNMRPAIAYLAVGTDDGMGHRVTQLRLARATSTDPAAPSDWSQTVMTTGAGTCAGLCGSQSCIAGAAATDPQVCITPTSDCSAACGTGDVCSAATCQTVIVDPMLDDIPTCTGLFVSLVLLPDGRLAAAYYDRNKRALVLGVESASGTSMFAETVIDGNVTGQDKGMWSSAVVAGDGTVHLAYQEALGDQLMYTTWANGTIGHARGRRRRRARRRSHAPGRRRGDDLPRQRLARDRVSGRAQLGRLSRDAIGHDLDHERSHGGTAARRLLDRGDHRSRHGRARVGRADTGELAAEWPRRSLAVTTA